MFLHRLALSLGMTIQQLLLNMDSQELSSWIAYDSIQPVGELMDDFRTGLVCSVVANANKGSKGKSLAPSDFMPYYKDKKKKNQTQDEMISVLMQSSRISKGNK